MKFQKHRINKYIIAFNVMIYMTRTKWITFSHSNNLPEIVVCSLCVPNMRWSPNILTHSVRSGSVLLSINSSHVTTVSANERRRYICNVFSHWLRPLSHVRTVSANERRRYICNVFSHWLRPLSHDLIFTMPCCLPQANLVLIFGPSYRSNCSMPSVSIVGLCALWVL